MEKGEERDDGSKRGILFNLYPASDCPICNVSLWGMEAEESGAGGLGAAHEGEIRRILHRDRRVDEDSMGGEEGMKIVPIKEFNPEEAERGYLIADFEDEVITRSDKHVFSAESFYEMLKSDRVMVEYQEKSPCGNTD